VGAGFDFTQARLPRIGPWAPPLGGRSRVRIVERPSAGPHVHREGHRPVLRFTGLGESSRSARCDARIGQVRALSQGRQASQVLFDNALTWPAVCGIVLIRKAVGRNSTSSPGPRPPGGFQATGRPAGLYAGYYVAELLRRLDEDLGPAPGPLRRGRAALGDFGGEAPVPVRLFRFEAVFLSELRYRPVLEACVSCAGALPDARLMFSPEAGGAVCPTASGCRIRRAGPLPGCLGDAPALGRRMGGAPDAATRAEMRHLMGTTSPPAGRPPRLLPYLGG